MMPGFLPFVDTTARLAALLGVSVVSHTQLGKDCITELCEQ